jgi:hypothetical protein
VNFHRRAARLGATALRRVRGEGRIVVSPRGARVNDAEEKQEVDRWIQRVFQPTGAACGALRLFLVACASASPA